MSSLRILDVSPLLGSSSVSVSPGQWGDLFVLSVVSSEKLFSLMHPHMVISALFPCLGRHTQKKIASARVQDFIASVSWLLSFTVLGFTLRPLTHFEFTHIASLSFSSSRRRVCRPCPALRPHTGLCVSAWQLVHMNTFLCHGERTLQGDWVLDSHSNQRVSLAWSRTAAI